MKNIFLFLFCFSVAFGQTNATTKSETAALHRIEKSKACGFDLNAVVTKAGASTRDEAEFQRYSYIAIWNKSGNMVTTNANCNNISAEIMNYMCRAPKGEKFYFENIKVKRTDGSIKKMPSLTLIIE